jgi:hypothetical protein
MDYQVIIDTLRHALKMLRKYQETKNMSELEIAKTNIQAVIDELIELQQMKEDNG